MQETAEQITFVISLAVYHIVYHFCYYYWVVYICVQIQRTFTMTEHQNTTNSYQGAIWLRFATSVNRILVPQLNLLMCLQININYCYLDRGETGVFVCATVQER